MVKGRDDILVVNWVDINVGVLNVVDEKCWVSEVWVDEWLLVYLCKVVLIVFVRLKDCDGDGVRERLGFVKVMRVFVCRINGFVIVLLNWLFIDLLIDKYDCFFVEVKFDFCW